jgi:hypothetical protein
MIEQKMVEHVRVARREFTFDTRHWRAVAYLACLALLGLVLYLHIRNPGKAEDFANGYRAAQGLRQLFAPAGTTSSWVGSNVRSNYYYDPAFVLLLLPLTLLPLSKAVFVWYCCITVFLAVSLYAIMRAADVRPSFLGFLLAFTAASVTSEVNEDYSLGQVNLLILCCVSVALWMRLRGRGGTAGFLLALACIVKPMYLIIPVFLLWKREFKVASVAIGVSIAASLVPFVWLGSKSLQELLRAWRLMSGPMGGFIANISPKGMLTRLFIPGMYVPPIVNMPVLATVFWLVVVLVVTLLTLAMLSPERLRADGPTLAQVGLVVTAALAISPLTETGYLNLLLLPLLSDVLLLRTVNWRRPPYRGIAASLVLLWAFASVPLKYFTRPVDLSIAHHRLFIDTSIVFSGSRFAILVGVFLLQLYILRVTYSAGRYGELPQGVLALPRQARFWLGDVIVAWKGRPRWLFRA